MIRVLAEEAGRSAMHFGRVLMSFGRAFVRFTPSPTVVGGDFTC